MTSTLMSVADWASREFSGAELGDKRRSLRLVQVAASFAQSPQGTLPGSFSQWSQAKAAYRLLEQDDVTYDRIVRPHLERVRTDCGSAGEYLMVEDTTTLDFSSHLAALDLGRVGDDGGRGLFLHSTLALKVQRWTPNQEPEVTVEGLLGQTWWARTTPTGRRHRPKRRKLTGPRESDRWAALTQETRPCDPRTQWTFLADRESDVYETFLRCRQNGWRFLIRASQPRALADPDAGLFTAAAQGPELGRFCLELRARPGQPARVAHVEIRACTVQLRGPWRPGQKLPPLEVQLVQAREIDPPQDLPPIHWVLLTDWPAQSFEQALRAVKTYTRRWLIEEYHKALKTGTHIEGSQLSTAQRIGSLLGVLAVVAVRLLSLKLLATTHPDQPVDVREYGEETFAILEAHYARPVGGWTNGTMLVSIAKLGGFLARAGDGSPGWQTIWRGLRQLMLMARGYDLAKEEKCG